MLFFSSYNSLHLHFNLPGYCKSDSFCISSANKLINNFIIHSFVKFKSFILTDTETYYDSLLPLHHSLHTAALILSPPISFVRQCSCCSDPHSSLNLFLLFNKATKALCSFILFISHQGTKCSTPKATKFLMFCFLLN